MLSEIDLGWLDL